MIRFLDRAPKARAPGLLALLACGLGVLAGCGPSTPLQRARTEVRPPTGWTIVAPDRWPVSGTPLAAWSGPSGASLVVSRSLAIPGGSAESSGKALVTRLANLPGLKVVEHRSMTVEGRPAARVEVVAPGTGDRLAPSGTGEPLLPNGQALVPTRRVVVIVPRKLDTIALTWHAPESAAGALAPTIDATLGTIRLGPDDLAPASY